MARPNTDETHEIFNPLKVKVKLYSIIFILLPAIILLLFYAAYLFYEIDPGMGFLPILVIYIPCFFIYKFLPLVAHMSSKVIFDKNGFSVERKGQKIQYKWSDISGTDEHYGLVGVDVLDKNKQVIYVYHYFSSGYWTFKNWLRYRDRL